MINNCETKKKQLIRRTVEFQYYSIETRETQRISTFWKYFIFANTIPSTVTVDPPLKVVDYYNSLFELSIMQFLPKDRMTHSTMRKTKEWNSFTSFSTQSLPFYTMEIYFPCICI